MVQEYLEAVAQDERALEQFCRDGLRKLIEEHYPGKFSIGRNDLKSIAYEFRDGGIYKIGASHPGDPTHDVEIPLSKLPLKSLTWVTDYSRTYEHDMLGVAKRIEKALKDAGLKP